MKDSVMAGIITLALGVGLIIGFCFIGGFREKSRIKDFDVIVIDTVNYDTRDIKKVKRVNSYSSEIEIEFEDGTVIITSCYTLKNK